MRHSNPYNRRHPSRNKWRLIFWLSMALLVLCGALVYFHPAEDWKTADSSSSGLAPLPEEEPEAVVQVYSARAFGWRKYFGVHTWIAVKEKNAGSYTVYQVMGYQLPAKGTSVSISRDIPDRKWFGAEPDLIQELRGKAAERAIPAISRTAEEYPEADTYRLIPGPNSNTFTAALMREVPELTVELPPHAVGKDYLPGGIAGRTESGTGIRINLWGLGGVSLGLAEGVEVSLLGLDAGFDLLRPALKLPMIGRIGLPDAPVGWDWWSIMLLLLAGTFIFFRMLRHMRQKRRQAHRIPHFRHPRTKTSERI